MIFEQTIANPKEVLPLHLFQFLADLQQNNSIDLSLFISNIQDQPNRDIRLFLLNYLHEQALLTHPQFVIFFSSFLSDSDNLIRWHVILYLGIYGTINDSRLLQPFLTDSYELVRAATHWSLAKLNPQLIHISTICSELKQASYDDRSRILLGSALYLLDPSPSSVNMQFLRKYFLSEYFDLETNNYYSDILLGKFGSSAEIFGAILWQAGIKITTSSLLSDLELLWLITR